VYCELKSRPPLQIVFLPLVLSIVFALCFPWRTRAEPLEDAARELAQKLMSALSARDTVSFTLQNRSSLSASDAAAIRAALENALAKSGIRLAPDGQTAHISVALSETLAAYMWIADVHRNDSSRIFIVNVGRDVRGQPPRAAPSLVIRRELLWEQNQPILDVAFPIEQSGARNMLVLEPKQISFFRWQGDRWVLNGASTLPRNTAVERVPRGSLNYRGELLSVVFERETCRSSITPGTEFKCEGVTQQPSLLADQRWSLLKNKIGMPLSLTQMNLAGRSVLFLTLPDGSARMYEAGTEHSAAFTGWGSDIAAVQSGCGTGWQLFATGKGDWTTTDTMQAYEIRDRQALSVSAAIEFPGPITSLRTSDDSRGVLAVVKNLSTYHYEVYHLSIACEK
jgi:hypothetical protein